MRFTLMTAAACTVALATSGTASAAKLDTRHLTEYREGVAKLRGKVDDKFGRDKGGLDILQWGIGPRNDRRRATTEQVKRYAGVLRRFLHPPAPAPTYMQGTAPTAQASTAPTGGSGGWVIPESIVMCESGGSWSAQNPSGAFGPYQLMPEHFSEGGACDDLGMDPGGQHSCAARLWNGGAGRSNWVC